MTRESRSRSPNVYNKRAACCRPKFIFHRNTKGKTPMSEHLTVLDHKPPTRPVLMAGARPQAIVPTTLEEAWRLAEMITKARMAPSALDTPEKVAVVILHGLEVGLMPMTALQSI